MQSFDWSRVWEGENVLVELTRKERALLLLYCSNLMFSPSTFLTGYDEETDLEAINDFISLLQFHLLDNPPDSAVTMLNIDLFTSNAGLLSGAGALNYNTASSLPFGYTIVQNNTTLLGMENHVWLRAGNYDYIGFASLTTVGGNTDVAVVDGVSIIDTIITNVSQNGAFNSRVKHTGAFTIPADGFYRIVVANNGTGSGTNRQCNWTSHHLRQTS